MIHGIARVPRIEVKFLAKKISTIHEIIIRAGHVLRFLWAKKKPEQKLEIKIR